MDSKPKGLGSVSSMFKPRKSKEEKARLKQQNKEHAEIIQQPIRDLRVRGEDKTEFFELGLILDCTNSMKPWIDRAKETLSEVIDEVLKQCNDDEGSLQVRVCFIGYRDHKDDERFSIMPFQDNIEMVKDFMAQVVAEGGKDYPEDVVGGLKMCLMQDWTEEASKKVFFVTDAPCHGKQFSGALDDHFPDGSPEGLQLDELMKEFCKKDIDFTMIKLNDTVDVMIKCMKECHQEMEVQNMSEEYVAAFVDQQPQDIQAMFREADRSRYIEMSNGVTAGGERLGAPPGGPPAMMGGPPPRGAPPMGPPPVKYEEPKIFERLNDPAFVNKGKAEKRQKLDESDADEEAEMMIPESKNVAVQKQPQQLQMQPQQALQMQPQQMQPQQMQALQMQPEQNSLMGAYSHPMMGPMMGGSLAPQMSAQPYRVDMLSQMVNSSEQAQSYGMSRKAQQVEMDRFYGQMAAQSAVRSVQQQMVRKRRPHKK